MKYQSHFAKWIWPVLAAGILLASSGILKNSSGVIGRNNNPDKFYLTATTNSLDYFFTYDPRAADEWLFHTGGKSSN